MHADRAAQEHAHLVAVARVALYESGCRAVDLMAEHLVPCLGVDDEGTVYARDEEGRRVHGLRPIDIAREFSQRPPFDRCWP